MIRYSLRIPVMDMISSNKLNDKTFSFAWMKEPNHIDLKNTGEIDITESHTFMRALLGRLNQFVLAPGSLTDIKV